MDPKRRCVVLSLRTFFWPFLVFSDGELPGGGACCGSGPETDEGVSGSTLGAAQGKKGRGEAKRASFPWSSGVPLVKQEPDPLRLEEPRSGSLLSNVT